MPIKVAGFLLSFAMALICGPFLIRFLIKHKSGQNINPDAPAGHAVKQGTPTMGGILFLFPVIICTLLYLLWIRVGESRHPENDFTLLAPLLMLIGFGAVGFADDWLSLKRGKNMGLKAREKLLVQCVLAGGFLFYMAATANPLTTTSVELLPDRVMHALALPQWTMNLGYWYYVLAGLTMVGLSNATNFSDGLDGLCGGLGVFLSLTLAALTSSLHPALSFYCITIAGGLCGFLWWNIHPAKIFMGDTGSLALGATFAAVALQGKTEVGMLAASLVFWAELISVMIQVSVFKWRKHKYGIEAARARRVFRRTPLHHHFEEMGIAETAVVGRFWLIGAVCAALALLWGIGGRL